MKKLLLGIGMVLGIVCATASAQSTGTSSVEPVIALGASSLSGYYPIQTFSPIILPAANTNGVHIRTFTSGAPAYSSISVMAKTTTPTTSAWGKAFLVGYGDVVGYQLNSTTVYYVPAGMGVWFYPDSASVSNLFVGATWTVD